MGQARRTSDSSTRRPSSATRPSRGRTAPKARNHKPFVAVALFALLVAVLSFLAISPMLPKSSAAPVVPASGRQTDGSRIATARPSTTGRLSVDGTNLVDSKGRHAVLRGISTHGTQWFPEYVNEELFTQLAGEWDCNLIRIVTYSEDWCADDRQAAKDMEVLWRGIDACINNDMYVLVDWHTLNDANPLENMEQAKSFFSAVSSHYPNERNILYEICNEPNGNTAWSDVHAYADEVIPVIRESSPDAVCVIGTTTYCQDLMEPARDPVGFDNVMYSLHFYAATHGVDLQRELTAALDEGLPVFVAECGLSEANGDGAVDFDAAAEWFSLLDDNDISYVVWNLSNKPETSSIIKATVDGTEHLRDEDLTPVGTWVKYLMQGSDPEYIPRPDVAADGRPVGSVPSWLAILGSDGIRSASSWGWFALAAVGVLAIDMVAWKVGDRRRQGRCLTYDDLIDMTDRMVDDMQADDEADGTDGIADGNKPSKKRGRDGRRRGWMTVTNRGIIALSVFLTVIYLLWRATFSIPDEYGWLAVGCNLVLLVIEVVGAIESLIHYEGMAGMRKREVPEIADSEYPEVDIFIATYNEPTELLRKTINGCNHLSYPDRSKVHVWVCDDNRRPEMRELAEEMHVGYFDRPDNEGAKAGNLNAALARTDAPYVVTLDADMIVRSDFLLKTIPYFVDAERRAGMLPEGERKHLGLLQTPQAFYEPDIFQHALYAENRVTNEQDFFYRTIEVSKVSTNSVIYGGSNTVIARRALEDIGGFYTGSVTEDFATGMLIEGAGYLSLATPEPLASGCTPHTFSEHAKQRTRWGRGVISTARQLHLLTRPGLTLAQRMSYLSSVSYWYSPIKNLVYMLAPLAFATFCIPMLSCTWLDLAIYWLPMFVVQTMLLRLVSGNAMSAQWSGIHEVSVMPSLFVPIVKETFGITTSVFKVTDKTTAKGGRGKADRKAMMPFFVLGAMSLAGIVRICWLLAQTKSIGLLVLLFWLLRNLYYIAMSLFLIDGRDSDGETVKVRDAIPVEVKVASDDPYASLYDNDLMGCVMEGVSDDAVTSIADTIGTSTHRRIPETGGTAPKAAEPMEGVATYLTDHSVRVFLDDGADLGIGKSVTVTLRDRGYVVRCKGVVVGRTESRRGGTGVQTVEVLDFQDRASEMAYLQVLHDRIPSLPQDLGRDLGAIPHLWHNVAEHLGSLGF